MRTKYEQDSFAVYKGFTFDTYCPRHGYIGLLTEDEKLAKKFDFLQDDDGYYKEVSPYEVTEYYQQSFKAVYKDIPVSIIVGDDDSVEIENTNLPWAVLKKAGFEVVNKGEYSKLVKTSELTDLHAIKEDLLEYAKQDFDEANKKKTV